jgi:hypothetical protein
VGASEQTVPGTTLAPDLLIFYREVILRMRVLILSLLAIVGIGLLGHTPKATAQVSVQIGPAPVCPYGYYDVAPYACAPAGYYGPEWFVNGVFIGAGPWFHGPANFHGHVNNRFHPEHGYHGPMPARGEKPEPAKMVTAKNFHGNEMRDGRGHVVKK